MNMFFKKLHGLVIPLFLLTAIGFIGNAQACPDEELLAKFKEMLEAAKNCDDPDSLCTNTKNNNKD